MSIRFAVCFFVLCGIGFAASPQQSTPPAPPRIEAAPSAAMETTAERSHKQQEHSVTINWHPSVTKGVEGYHVYRSEEGDKQFVRITKRPIKETDFTDKKVQPGKAYSYAVSAVQRVGKKEVESERTPPVTVHIPGT